MKRSITAALLAAMLLLVSCNGNGSDPAATDTAAPVTTGAVTTAEPDGTDTTAAVTEKPEATVAPITAEVTETVTNAEEKIESVTELDENGNKLRTVNYNEEGKAISYTTYTYAEGSVTERDFTPTNVLITRRECTCDANGNYTAVVCYTASGTVSASYEYTYDYRGLITDSYCYDGKGEFLWHVGTEYGWDGVKTKEIFYDSDGNATKELNYNPDGSLVK